MSQVNQLLESAAGSWKNLQSDAAKLAGKWARTGLLQGLGEVDKNNMSLMLENQAKQLVTETNGISSNSYFTSGTEGENWAGIALPLVRKVFGTIVAKEFVSVQPMNMPSGLVFFLDFQYGNAKTPFAVGESLYGDRNASGQFPFATPAAEGGLYGAGRFAYSTNQFTASIATGSVVVTVSTDYKDIDVNDAYSASFDAGEIWKVTVATPANADLDGVAAFVISSSDVTLAENLMDLTTVSGLNQILFFVTSSTQPTFNPASVYFNKLTTDTNRGDFEADQALPGYASPNDLSATNIVIPEINVKMQSQAITAKTKKLKDRKSVV